MSRPQQHSTTFRRLAAVLLVLLTTVQLPGVVGLMFAGLAWIDGDHRVSFSASLEGSRVVLKHDADAVAESQFSDCHEHCFVSRFLVTFEAPHLPKQTDHVLLFGSISATSLKGEQRETVPASAFCARRSLVIGHSFASGHHHGLPAACRPPASAAETSFASRTVLLI